MLEVVEREDHAGRYATSAVSPQQEGVTASQQIADLLDRGVAERCGPNSTFEERQEVAAALMAEALTHLLGADGSDKEGV